MGAQSRQTGTRLALVCVAVSGVPSDAFPKSPQTELTDLHCSVGRRDRAMLKINWKNSGQRNRLLSLPAEVLMS
ncbi:MAG: hypothetical protein KC518_12860, partial [Candidatus Cloacimonetes bacterium]|nr:hypothetical protein [Candidatus Cloacimonadota bacterium]